MVNPTLDVAATEPVRYATFTGRCRALVTDLIIVSVGMVVILIVGDLAENVPGSGRIAWFGMFGLFFLYEPLLIWRRGATIGHARNQLRVVVTATGQPPGLLRSFARYFSKAILGLPSFVTMALTPKHQAVHDWLTQTTVQVSPDTDADEVEFHLERSPEQETLLPSRWRRALVMLAYLVGVYVLFVIVLVVIASGSCASDVGTCTGGRRVAVQLASFAWLAISLAAIVSAWKGLLPGARRLQAARTDSPTA
jgi:uncharacterized RDD family membrane protein YckC